MRICWIKAGGLVPADFGGRIRSFQMVKALAKRHAVTMATFYRRETPDAHRELDGMFEKLVLMPLDLPPSRSKQDLLLYAKTFFSGLPHSMAKYYQPEVQRTITDLLTRETFDVVVCDFLHPAGLLNWRMPAKTVLFTHNNEAEVWQRQAKVSRSFAMRMASRLEYRAMSAAEAKYLKMADHVVAVSQANKDYFAQFIPAERVTVVSTGVDTEFFRPNADAEQPNHAVFTGSYDWMPNGDAMDWYMSDILPLVRKELPEVHTWAVGKAPTDAMLRFGQEDPTFHVTGRVDEVRSYIDKGSIYIVPMRSGSGTRLKVFEAMACGKAIVSTRAGAEGLPVEHGKSMILADSAEDFAREMVRLMRDRELRERLGREARALVEGRYSWDRVGEEFESILVNAKRTFPRT